MNQRRIFISISMLLLLWGNCAQKDSDSELENAVPVEITEVTHGRLDQTLVFHGDIHAELEIKVFSKVPDRIELFYVDEGDEIQKNAPIAKILATTIEQSVLQAEAGFSAASAQRANMQLEHARSKRLYREKAMSQQQFDAVNTQYEAAVAQAQQAEAALTSAKSLYKDATVSAPISGIVGKRYYEVGDMVSPALPLVSIVQMDQVKIAFQAPERDLGRLVLGQKARVRVRSYEDTDFLGKVYKISPVLDPLTRMASIEVLIPNANHKLKPGMFAEVEIVTGSIEDHIVIPRYSVIENTSLASVEGNNKVVKNFFVYIINDSSRAEQRQLNVKYVNHTNIAVVSGISAGESLVISGQNNLRDGSLVIIPEKEETEL